MRTGQRMSRKDRDSTERGGLKDDTPAKVRRVVDVIVVVEERERIDAVLDRRPEPRREGVAEADVGRRRAAERRARRDYVERRVDREPEAPRQRA